MRPFRLPTRLPVRLAVVLVLVAVGTAQAQRAPSIFDDPIVAFQAQRGLEAANDLRFSEAIEIADGIEQRYPNHPAPAFLRALPTWWRILLDLTNSAQDARFSREMDEVIRRSDALLDRDPENFDARFFRGAALGFQGRVESNRSDWFNAARRGRAAMNDVFYVARRNPDNPDFGFGRGLYDYFAAVIPERYPFARPVLTFFPDADRARGLAALQRAAASGTFMKTEAAYFLAQIYYLYEEDYGLTMQYVRDLRTRHPNNPFFLAFEGRVQARWGYWDASRVAFQGVLAAYGPTRPEFAGLAEQALYYVARADLAQGRPDEALRSLVRVEALTARFREPSYYRVLGRLRQGMAFDALGRRDEALLRYRQVLDGPDYADAHDRARDYLERPYGG